MIAAPVKVLLHESLQKSETWAPPPMRLFYCIKDSKPAIFFSCSKLLRGVNGAQNLYVALSESTRAESKLRFAFEPLATRLYWRMNW
jgi:hypothetical protein